MRRILNILIALDQLAFVLLSLGKGNPDETISAALYRMEKQGKWWGKMFRPVIDWLFLPFEQDHCMMSFLTERARTHLHSYYTEIANG